MGILSQIYNSVISQTVFDNNYVKFCNIMK